MTATISAFRTATPIKHLVVIFQENVSFDHYFGSYPNALNNAGETPFEASLETTPRSINNLLTPLDVNNEFRPARGRRPDGQKSQWAAWERSRHQRQRRLQPVSSVARAGAHVEIRITRIWPNSLPTTMEKWTRSRVPPAGRAAPKGYGKNIVMGYYDGNTVTAMWNYAQHFALNDNSWTTTFGPSTPGALNLISGQTNGIDAALNIVDGSGKLLHRAMK